MMWTSSFLLCSLGQGGKPLLCLKGKTAFVNISLDFPTALGRNVAILILGGDEILSVGDQDAAALHGAEAELVHAQLEPHSTLLIYIFSPKEGGTGGAKHANDITPPMLTPRNRTIWIHMRLTDKDMCLTDDQGLMTQVMMRRK